MRTTPAVALGFVVGIACAVVALRWMDATPPATVAAGVAGHPTTDPRTAQVAATPVAARAIEQPPTTRDRVAPMQALPDPASPYAAPRVIYRCVVKGRTTYSNEACPNGSVVDETSAVNGFDSRTSPKLERLVADGRANSVDAVPPSQATRSKAVGPASPFDECPTLRRQIVDIDARMRYPNDPRVLDDLRQTRQDIRTSMARLHC